jgi:hypothetical protein
MLNVPMSLRVFAKTTPTDMRKSFDGLAGLVEQELGQQVESGHWPSPDLCASLNERICG